VNQLQEALEAARESEGYTTENHFIAGHIRLAKQKFFGLQNIGEPGSMKHYRAQFRQQL
jgi:hypothetical protein